MIHRSDRPNHCCRQWVLTINSRSNGGRSILATGPCGAMRDNKSLQGMTWFISSSKICLRVRWVLRSSPRFVCFMPLSLQFACFNRGDWSGVVNMVLRKVPCFTTTTLLFQKTPVHFIVIYF